jgi:2-oxoisovalerate dehydrogenase E1 component
MGLPDLEKLLTRVRDLMKGLAAAPRRIGGSGLPPISAAPLPIPVAPPAPAASATVDSPPSAAAAPDAMPGEPITMPHGDLTVSEGTVVNWHKAVGDTLVAGEVVAEVETDKALVEIESPKAGKLIQILVPVGQVVKMGGTLGAVG